MFKNLIKDKDVCLVGNAKSLFRKYSGKKIDAHDVVVRFNKGLPKKTRAQGERTDILFLAYLADKIEVEKFDAKVVIFRRGQFKKPDISGYIYKPKRFDSAKLKIQQKKVDGEGSNPSSGFLMIELLLDVGAGHITLYGFDWGKTPSYYNTPEDGKIHNYRAEEKIIRDYAKKGLITIVE